MDAKTLKAVSTLGLLVVAAACSPNAGAGSGAGDTTKAVATAGGTIDANMARQTVDSFDRQFATAFKAGDAATAASFYEEGATSMPPNQEAESGRAAIEKGYADLFKMVGKVDDFTAEVKDVDAYGDHIIEIGTYAFTFTPPGAKESQKDHGHYFNYWRKQADGSWKIHRDLIVSANPMPNMAPAKK